MGGLLLEMLLMMRIALTLKSSFKDAAMRIHLGVVEGGTKPKVNVE